MWQKSEGEFMERIRIAVSVFIILVSTCIYAKPTKGRFFDRAIFIIFENASYSKVMKQPFFKKVADQGVLFNNFLAITHPSQGNYVALTSGDLNGVEDDGLVTVDVRNIVDLLEEKGISWKVYAEDYPGNCFQKWSKGSYTRKHNPFISYLNIQNNFERCSKIVSGDQFDIDAQKGVLPEYVFYIPNLKNDGHDTGIEYANNWFEKKWSPYFRNPQFMKETAVITTFDESSYTNFKNQIYLSIIGSGVRQGVVNKETNLYSLLRLIEDNWFLGDLRKYDSVAAEIPSSIWK